MNSNLIYDIGMNNGDDTAYYLARGYKVVAVEANPVLAEKTTKRFQTEVDSGQLKILNVGVAHTESVLPFWICDGQSEWSSFDRSVASRSGLPHHEIQIPCRRFASIVEEYGTPYYLKVDIEGNDILCLQDLKGQELPKYVSVEAGNPELLGLLRDLGYTKFKCISQFTFLPVDVESTQLKNVETIMWLFLSRNPIARAFRGFGGRAWVKQQLDQIRSRSDWQFPLGTSGPFGEELAGSWKTFDEMVSTYQYFQDLQAQGKESMFWDSSSHSFWADFHASF